MVPLAQRSVGSQYGDAMPILPDLPQTETAIVAMTNAFRQDHGLGRVAPNRELAAAARWFAEYLAKTGKFAHEADGREPQQRAAAHGYKYCMVGENLAMNLDSRGFTSDRLASEVIEGWKKSPPHRRTLLEAGMTEIGVAIARGPDKHPKFISVQLLGRPEALKTELEVRNATGYSVSYSLAGEAHTIEPRTITTHTSCSIGELSFERAGNWLSGIALNSHFAVGDGDRFTIQAAPNGNVHVRQEAGAKK